MRRCPLTFGVEEREGRGKFRRYLVYRVRLHRDVSIYSANVLHRDVKTSNLVLNANYVRDICDFSHKLSILSPRQIYLGHPDFEGQHGAQVCHRHWQCPW